VTAFFYLPLNLSHSVLDFLEDRPPTQGAALPAIPSVAIATSSAMRAILINAYENASRYFSMNGQDFITANPSTRREQRFLSDWRVPPMRRSDSGLRV
jgi:hypothetical protein